MRFGIQVRNVFNLERLFKKNKSGRNLQREIVNPMEASPDQFEATLFHHLLPMGNGFCEGLLGYAQLIWSIKKSQEDGKLEVRVESAWGFFDSGKRRGLPNEENGYAKLTSHKSSLIIEQKSWFSSFLGKNYP